LHRDLANDAATLELVDSFDDAGLAHLMTNLGGHCVETLMDAFAQCDDERPTLFIAYTIKGFGLPFAGHKDNHSGLMTETQISALRDQLGITAGEEWEPFAGLGNNVSTALRAFLDESGFARAGGDRDAELLPVPPLSAAVTGEDSTQVTFGRILLDLAKSQSALADRIVTTSPDVTVSTNLGAWVNQRGLFRRSALADVFRDAKIPSAQKWQAHEAGQHIELGIAENNLFLMLAALGLAGPLFGTRLMPVGTVYDPFIARGLDALNYACYQDARFLLVATPSGVTLGPEGGAHQSINTPLIGMGQPGLTSFEPAFADELAAIMEWAFRHMQEVDGGSVYLRLSTRKIRQAGRSDDSWREGLLRVGYWLQRPQGTTAIVYMGALVPEAMEAWARLKNENSHDGVGLLAITSPDILHRDWSEVQAHRAAGGECGEAHIETLLRPLGRDGRMVTLVDGSPSALSWLGAVLAGSSARARPFWTNWRFTGLVLRVWPRQRCDREGGAESISLSSRPAFREADNRGLAARLRRYVRLRGDCKWSLGSCRAPERPVSRHSVPGRCRLHAVTPRASPSRTDRAP
jgi:pyruvate dehydrogenase E1 component